MLRAKASLSDRMYRLLWFHVSYICIICSFFSICIFVTIAINQFSSILLLLLLLSLLLLLLVLLLFVLLIFSIHEIKRMIQHAMACSIIDIARSSMQYH